MADKKDKPEEDLQTEILLKEADEALRQEQLERLWKEWGQTIIGVALMVIFGTMLGVGWKSWRASVYAAQTATLVQAEEKGLIGLESAKDDLSGDYAGMAALISAGEIAVATQSSSMTVSQMVYEKMKLAEDAGLPRRYDILAEWGALRTETDANPEADHQAIAQKMEKLAGKRDNPYQPLILMEAAVLYGENGDNDKAVEILTQTSELESVQENNQLGTMIDNLKHLYTLDKNRT